MTEASHRVHWFVKLLVIVHLIAIVSWSIPNPPKAILSGQRAPIGTDWILVGNANYLKTSPLRDYLIFTATWQYWDMFAPNPSNWDGWVDSVITYQDGSTKVFPYPRMQVLSIPQKYLKERYRKYLERAAMPENSWMWPRFAQRLALEAWDDPQNPPVQVELRKHERWVQPPDKPQQKGYKTTTYYNHVVDDARLREDAAR